MCVCLTIMIFTFKKVQYKVSCSTLGKEGIKGGYIVGKRCVCPCHISGPLQGGPCNFSYDPTTMGENHKHVIVQFRE